MRGETAVEKCPACGDMGSKIGTSLGAGVFACAGCDLWFLAADVRPNTDRDNHWYGDIDELSAAEVTELTRQMAGPYRRQLRKLAALAPGRDLLDVGCGIGMFLHEARRDWQAYGLETSNSGRNFAQQRLGVCVKERLEELPVHRFDVIRLSHVMEHVPEPGDFMRWVFGLLNPGGIVMIIVPNRESLVYWALNRIARLRASNPPLRAAVYPDMHVLGFSMRSLERTANRAGLQTVSANNVSMGNRDYYPLFYDGLLRVQKFSEIKRRKIARYYLPLLLANLGNPIGLGEWIVGLFRKPAT